MYFFHLIECNDTAERLLKITLNTNQWTYFMFFFHVPDQGRIQDFKLGGGARLKKLRRAEGGAKIFGVFRVKNHDFTPKNHIFPILGGAREIFGVFHVKNHDFTPKKNHIFTNFRGGGGRRCAPPPESAPADYFTDQYLLFLSVL